jgi:hypothetical protein
MSNPFFCFPLCLLAMPADDDKRRMLVIVSNAMERAGTEAKIEDESQRIGSYLIRNEVSGYNGSERHKAMVRGAIVCNVSMHNLPNTIKEADGCRAFTQHNERLYGPGPLVFISTELFWECRDRDEPTYREFTTLCGINSIIGFKKTPVLIRRGMVIARQLGFKTPAVMEAELKKNPALKPLTTQQLRNTLDHLEARDLLRRCQATRTCVYFSTTMPDEELRAAVKGIRQKKDAIRFRREVDRQLLAGTKQEPSENHLKRKQAVEPEKEPLKNTEPSENQVGSTGGTKREPQAEPLKEVPSKEVPLNKSLSTNGGTGAPPLFPRELDALIAEAEQEIRRRKHDPESKELVRQLRENIQRWKGQKLGLPTLPDPPPPPAPAPAPKPQPAGEPLPPERVRQLMGNMWRAVNEPEERATTA